MPNVLGKLSGTVVIDEKKKEKNENLGKEGGDSAPIRCGPRVRWTSTTSIMPVVRVSETISRPCCSGKTCVRARIIIYGLARPVNDGSELEIHSTV